CEGEGKSLVTATKPADPGRQKRRSLRFGMVGLLSIFAAISGGAPAAGLDLDANYGNESGCAYAIEGIADGDDVMLVTPNAIETYATYCELVDMTPMSQL